MKHSCTLSRQCGKAYPAAVVASGGRIGDVDTRPCPITGPTGRHMLPIPAAEG